MSIEVIALGGDGGRRFEEQAVKSIGVRSGKRIDALLLNNQRFGGKGGKERRVLELQGDEYINAMSIRHGRLIDQISLTTSRGRTFGAGGGGGRLTQLNNIRVLGLGGNSGDELDKLRIRYIKDYTESAVLEESKSAVISVIPQGQAVEFFDSRRVSQLNATRRLMETVFSVQTTTESGAVGEFISKVNSTFGLSLTNQVEITQQVETEEFSSEKLTYAPPAGHVGVEIVQFDVFQASDSTVWVFPVSEPSIVSVKVDQGIPTEESVYDMTGTLGLHVPAIADRRGKRNGYDYYSTTS